MASASKAPHLHLRVTVAVGRSTQHPAHTARAITGARGFARARGFLSR